MRYLAKVPKSKLDAITGGSFTIDYGGSRGIRLGLLGDFPDWPRTGGLAASGAELDREEHVIRSIPGWGTVALVARNEVALEHALWAFLDHLGYRQYLPSLEPCALEGAHLHFRR